MCWREGTEGLGQRSARSHFLAFSLLPLPLGPKAGGRGRGCTGWAALGKGRHLSATATGSADWGPGKARSRSLSAKAINRKGDRGRTVSISRDFPPWPARRKEGARRSQLCQLRIIGHLLEAAIWSNPGHRLAAAPLQPRSGFAPPRPGRQALLRPECGQGCEPPRGSLRIPRPSSSPPALPALQGRVTENWAFVITKSTRA